MHWPQPVVHDAVTDDVVDVGVERQARRLDDPARHQDSGPPRREAVHGAAALVRAALGHRIVVQRERDLVAPGPGVGIPGQRHLGPDRAARRPRHIGERAPDRADFLAARGMAHIASRTEGSLDRAATDLDRAIELEPRASEYYVLRGLLYERAQRLSIAHRRTGKLVVACDDSELETLAEIRERGPIRPPVAVKIRTGGLTPDAFPTPRDVAGFLTAARRTGLAYKATAGLQDHPRRGPSPTPSCAEK